MNQKILIVVIIAAALLLVIAFNSLKATNPNNTPNSTPPTPTPPKGGDNDSQGGSSNANADADATHKFTLLSSTKSTMQITTISVEADGSANVIGSFEVSGIPSDTLWLIINDMGTLVMNRTNSIYSLFSIDGRNLTRIGSSGTIATNVRFAFAPDRAHVYVLGNGTNRIQLDTSTMKTTNITEKSSDLQDNSVAVNYQSNIVLFGGSNGNIAFYHTSDFSTSYRLDTQVANITIRDMSCAPNTNSIVASFNNKASGSTRLQCMTFSVNTSLKSATTGIRWTYAPPSDAFMVDKILFLNPSTVVFSRQDVSSKFDTIGVAVKADTKTPTFSKLNLIDAVTKQVSGVENRTSGEITQLGASGHPDYFFVGTTDGKAYLCHIDSTKGVQVRFINTYSKDSIVSLKATLSPSSSSS